MQSQKGTYGDAPSANEPPQVHAEISAVQFDERLLPIYEEHQRHKMGLEKQEQEDNTKIALQLMADTSEITRRGQLIGGGIALVALIGGLILVAIDKDAVGSAVLILDAVFVFSQKLVKPNEKDVVSKPKQ